MTKEDGTAYDWAATYYPFGEMTQTGNGANTHGFTGKEFDTEMGLNYFCLRYYDPQIGRFMTLDPFGGYVELPQSQNRYAYVMNNPLKYIDPLGLNGDDDYPFYGWIEGVEARAHRYYELWYATSRGHGGGQDVPGRPPPELPVTREDLAYLHLVPGWTVDENGNVVRILPEQKLSDRPQMFPWVPSPSLGQILDYREIYTSANTAIMMSNLAWEREKNRITINILTVGGGVIAEAALICTGVGAPVGVLGGLYLTGGGIGVTSVVITLAAPPGSFTTRERLGIIISGIGGVVPHAGISLGLLILGYGISDSASSPMPMVYPSSQK